MAKVQREEKVEGLGEIYSVSAPWDVSLTSLKSQGIMQPITARDLAYSRIQKREKSSLCLNGSYVREGILYTPKKSILLVRNSPLLTKTASQKATQAHRQGKEYFLDIAKYQEQAEEDTSKSPIKRRVFILNQGEDFVIPTNKFGNEELTRWLFKEQAEDYGKFLEEQNINEMPIWLVGQNYVNKQNQSFARQLWLGRLDSRSGLAGDDGGLDFDNRSRGVLKTREASSQQIKTSYTQKEIKTMENLIQGVREGRLPASKLDKVSQLLKKLEK